MNGFAPTVIMCLKKRIHKPNYKQILTSLGNNNKLLYDPSFIFNNGVHSVFKEPQNTKIPIRERALLFFNDIYGHDNIKETIYRALMKENRSIHIILVGPPSTGKTIFLKIIMEKCNGVVFHNSAAGSTGAGLFIKMEANRQSRILCIDEVTETRSKRDNEALRGVLDDGTFSKTTQAKMIDFQIKGLKVFMTTNNPSALSVPFKKRCQMILIDKYTDEEFRSIFVFNLLRKGIIKNEELANGIANAMLYYKIKNMRTALSIAMLINEDIDTKDDIIRIIKSYIQNDASAININYNEVEI